MSDEAWKFFAYTEISLKFVPAVPVDNLLPLVQEMAWCHSGNKLSAIPMMTKFHDGVWHHKSKCVNILYTEFILANMKMSSL